MERQKQNIPLPLIPAKRNPNSKQTRFMLPSSRHIQLSLQESCQEKEKENEKQNAVQYIPSKKTLQCLQKSQQILQEQILKTEQYMGALPTMLDKIYKNELYRSHLQQVFYRNLVNKMKNENAKIQTILENTKQQKDSKFKGIVEQIAKLSEMKGRFQEMLQKVKQELLKQKNKLNQAESKNQEVKLKIKEVWKQIGDKDSEIKGISTVNRDNGERKGILGKSGSRRSSKNKQFKFVNSNIITEGRKTEKSVLIQQDESPYITNNLIQSGQATEKQLNQIATNEHCNETRVEEAPTRSPRRSPTHANTIKLELGKHNSDYEQKEKIQIQIQPSLLTTKIKNKIDDSGFSHYWQAIKKIQDLEMSIIEAKRDRDRGRIKKQTKRKQRDSRVKGERLSKYGQDKQKQSLSQPEQANHKKKIKQKISEIEYTIQMLKLLVIYLKSGENRQSQRERSIEKDGKEGQKQKQKQKQYKVTSFGSLRKIICYFQKLLQNKMEVLNRVKQMGKNLGI